MKKKVLLFTAILSVLFVGVVSASSLWGTYKGNNIVRLTVNGTPVQVPDVPAINYNGRTMIPIYLLKQAGIEYAWNDSTNTVDIVKKEPVTQTLIQKEPVYGFSQLTKELSSSGVALIGYTTDGDVGIVAFDYKYTSQKLSKDNSSYNAILKGSTKTDAAQAIIRTSDKIEISYPVDKARDLFNGKITGEQFQGYYTVKNNGTVVSSPSTSSSNNQSGTGSPSNANTTTTDSQNDAHIAACKALSDQQVLDMAAFERNNDPFSGSTAYKRDQLQQAQAAARAATGC